MGHVVIGIHGLDNKPAPEILAQGWKAAMLEGLQKNQNLNLAEDDFDYIPVYWADAEGMYDEYDDNADTYVPAELGRLKTDRQCKSGIKREIGNIFTNQAEDLAEQIDSMKASFGIHSAADKLLSILLKDLNKYYQNKSIQSELRNRLKTVLEKKAGQKIMLIGHSMGSIIAYDVLREIGREQHPAAGRPIVTINQFVTIGSPLGIPHIRQKIEEEFLTARIPTYVQNWVNFADRRDPVAMDAHLNDDYHHGHDFLHSSAQTVQDIRVCNDWIDDNAKIQIHHKSYGYLRTPEFSELLANFV